MGRNKLYKSFMSAGIIFITGMLALILGVNGEAMAITLSRPSNESSWSTSAEMIDGFTFLPMLIGVFLFVLSIVIFGITLNNWQQKA